MEEGKQEVSVLVVDDDHDVLDYLCKIIEHKGWKCLTAPTGEIGLDAFKKNEVSTVLLDVKLPRMDGFEVLKEMKGLKPNIPVVMLTGLGYEKEIIDKAVKLGAAGYVGKSMPVQTVIATIKRVLGHK